MRVGAPHLANVLYVALTRTSPQSHGDMLGFGSASVAYMTMLETAIVESAVSAKQAAKPRWLRHMRTPSLHLSVNRRERVSATHASGASPPTKKQRGASTARQPNTTMWFEEAGATTLGRREEGPTVPFADIVQFMPSPGGVDATPIATLVSYACHPSAAAKDTTSNRPTTSKPSARRSRAQRRRRPCS